jgi:putative DNA primase/helicase
MTPTEVLEEAGLDRPSNGQAKECAALLRELYGDSKRVNGRDRWRVHLASEIRAAPPITPAKPSKFD